MGIAALLILVFHFYIPVFGGPVETFFYKVAYLGVDLFFFVSAYSQGTRKEMRFGSLMKNRLAQVYLPFVIFALINMLYKGQKWKTFFKNVSGVSFFEKGGGSFLWFVIGIMLLYLVSPAIWKAKKRWGLPSLAGFFAAWLVIVLVLQYGFDYTTIFILLNRIPIFLIGFYTDLLGESVCKWIPERTRSYFLITGLAIGAILVYYFGTTVRLGKPVAEMYYITAIPFCLSGIALLEMLTERFHLRLSLFRFLGTLTLELYGFQMIFGYKIETAILKATGMKIAAFPGTAAILIFMSHVFHTLWAKGTELLKRRKDKIL